MRFHRDLADAEFEAYLLVQPAGDDQCHDLLLAPAERGVAVAQRLDLLLLIERCAAVPNRLPDGAQQYFVAERLHQELDRSRLHGLNRHRHIAVPGDEDDWHVIAAAQTPPQPAA